MDEYRNLTAYEEHLVRNFPTLTETELQTVNDSFPHYCFLHKCGDGVEVTTSCCHVKRFYPWLREIDDPEDRELMYEHRHNDEGVCPYCGRPVTFKHTEKCGKFKKLCKQDCVVFWKFARGAVWAQAYWVRKTYEKDYLKGKVEYYFDTGYVFRPGETYEFSRCYSKWYAIWEHDKIGRCIQITEPFLFGGMFHDRMCDWLDIGRGMAIDSSFLRYQGLDKYDARWYCQHSTPMKFLTLSCIYPRAIEMLMKAGMMNVIEEFTDKRKKHAAAIRWDADNPVDAFGITKPELREFLATKREIGVLENFKYCKKHGLKTSFADIDTVYSELFCDSQTKEFYRNCEKYRLTPTKLWNYLNKFTGPRCHGWEYFRTKEAYQLWHDYLYAAQEIGYDMKNPVVILPKQLELAHDEATGELQRRLTEQRKAEQEAAHLRWLLDRTRESYVERECDWLEYIGELLLKAKFQKTIEKRAQRFAFSDGVWFIRIARSADEIIAEGKALQHCVGGYAQRHVEGRTTILFMRRVTEPDKPTLTIEFCNGKLIQVHGFKNEYVNGKRLPDPEKVHKAFLDSWLDWIGRGSPRDKDGLPVLRKSKKKKEAAA